MRMNRGELLVKAISGNIKKGDKFKSNINQIITFDGQRFRWSDNEIMQLNMLSGETFEPHEETVTVKLTQKEINSIRVLIGDECFSGLQRKQETYSHPFDIINNGGAYNDMFDKFQKLVK